MPLYTFHAFRSDGAPLTLVSAEFPSAELANEHAAMVLDAHLSAQSVVVWRDETEISSIERV